MNDLTEKWKAGELESGYYYIIVKKEFSNRIDFYNSSATIWSYHSNDVIKQVLAPVPSYEEGKAKDSQTDYLQQKVSVLESKNQQLKFLLKECRYKIIADLDNARLCESSVDIEDFEYLLNRIDNAIGEN